MKKTILNSLTICTLFFATALNAQVGVGVPAENIHPSAELEVKSNTKGFLPPRMTNAERNDITSPAAGLLIYQTDAVANNPAGLYFYDGTAWRNGAGVQGIKGDQGDQGPKGDAGAQGLPGSSKDEQKLSVSATGDTLYLQSGGFVIIPGLSVANPKTKPTIDCGGATNNGTLTANTAASGVSSVLAYTGGNGGTYASQEIASTGVTGLTATLSAGTFANGEGNLTYTITGTPTASGKATFNINIGGYTCTLTRTIVQPTSGFGANITDVDGNSYKTVYIGTQQWMAENLKVTKYNDGTAIPNITDDTQWSQLSTGAWSYYNNDVANNAKYGKLYNWYALSKTSNSNKNVCPTGWHVPTDAEWTVLTKYLGSADVAGGKMKEVGTTSWNSPNTDATNTSLFTALPGGYRSSNGYYKFIGSNGFWWGSAEGSTNLAWYHHLDSSWGLAFRDITIREFGMSVRCLKD